MQVCLQFEHFAPFRVQRLVLRVRLNILVDDVEGAERVALAVHVGRGEAFTAHHFHLQPADVVDVLQ